MSFHNGLSDAQSERLAILAEECSEVVKAVTKILRHGYESNNPYRPEEGTNRQMLEMELGHVHCIMTMMVKRTDIDSTQMQRASKLKKKSIRKFLHHNVYIRKPKS